MFTGFDNWKSYSQILCELVQIPDWQDGVRQNLTGQKVRKSLQIQQKY